MRAKYNYRKSDIQNGINDTEKNCVKKNTLIDYIISLHHKKKHQYIQYIGTLENIFMRLFQYKV